MKANPGDAASARFSRGCHECRYSRQSMPCPIKLAQEFYGERANENDIATGILNMLVDDDGECAMRALDPENFLERRGPRVAA